MKSVMTHDFGRTPSVQIPRAQFNRSHGIKTTFDAGKLVPFLVDDIVPGDTVNCNATLFARLATPLKPVMDNMRLETFYFFVPNRLLWSNWTKFMGEQDDPGDSIDFTIPTYTSTYTISGGNNTFDYFGLPIGKADVLQGVSALPARAYNLIWNQWFRDENLQDSLTVDLGDGPDTPSEYYNLQNRGKRFDYFTSCLPWPQKGATAVQLPLGSTAPVEAIDDTSGPTFSRLGSATADDYGFLNQTGVATVVWQNDDTDGAAVWNEPNLQTDLATATAATINQMRLAFAQQRFLERDARGGTRYIEVIQSHFGVKSSDARLQRAEYLGGGSSAVGIQPVANTSADGTQVQGELTGFGTVLATNHGFVKSFEEHGYIIGLANVRADLTYQKGIERHWSRSTRYDFLFPVFSHIGEQEVLNKEIFYNNDSNDDLVFGYNGRYDEYRFKPSQITGLFRSDATSSLDVWHLSQDFASLPVLNSSFIQDDPPIDRVIAAPSEPHFIMDGFIEYKHARPLPVFGTPGLIDHF